MAREKNKNCDHVQQIKQTLSEECIIIDETKITKNLRVESTANKTFRKKIRGTIQKRIRYKKFKNRGYFLITYK